MEEKKNDTEQKSVPVRLPEPGTLLVSSSPHVHDRSGTAKIMVTVMVALLPAAVMGIWYFGAAAVTVMLYCMAFCVLWEYLWNRIAKAPQTISDFSAALTGLILAMNLPPAASWWLCMTGSFIAIVIAKQVFGGLGQNPFNPAAVARVALLTGFAGPMTRWFLPARGAILHSAELVPLDAVSGATPLGHAMAIATNTAGLPASTVAEQLANLEKATLHDCFFGFIPGSLGETCTIALLAGGLLLALLKIIRWQIPAAILGTVIVFTWLVNLAFPHLTPGPAYHLVTGGLMIGAFFMATDTVTSPVTRKGCFLYGAGIGLLTCIIRIWGAYPEGMSFSILIMNALVPLIDRVCYTRPFGWVQGGNR